MKWILKRLRYEVNDDAKASHKILNGADIVLVLVYLGISLYNTFSGINHLEFFDSNGEFYPSNDTIKTVVTILINIIIALRLYIRAWIQWNDDLDYATGILKEDELYDKVIIEASKSRQRFIECIVIVIVTLAFALFYLGSAATPLCAVIVAVITVLSCVNNIIDIMINMYSAKLRPSRLIYFEWR